jgi:hypothetical protein
MPRIFEDVPEGWIWGWYSNDDQRMHLRPLRVEHRTTSNVVWLEDQEGEWIFEPACISAPAEVLDALHVEVKKSRKFIEECWTREMLYRGWLGIEHTEKVVTLTVYPTTRAYRFTVLMVGPAPAIENVDYDLDKVTLILKTSEIDVEIPIAPIIWPVDRRIREHTVRWCIMNS